MNNFLAKDALALVAGGLFAIVALGICFRTTTQVYAAVQPTDGFLLADIGFLSAEIAIVAVSYKICFILCCTGNRKIVLFAHTFFLTLALSVLTWTVAELDLSPMHDGFGGLTYLYPVLLYAGAATLFFFVPLLICGAVVYKFHFKEKKS